jgi:hypothetical protein
LPAYVLRRFGIDRARAFLRHHWHSPSHARVENEPSLFLQVPVTQPLSMMACMQIRTWTTTSRLAYR